MTATSTAPRLTSFAPQFFVSDLDRAMAFYRDVLGFTFKTWQDFYAIGLRDGLEIHLKHGPTDKPARTGRKPEDKLDASAGISGIEAFYAEVQSRIAQFKGAKIVTPLTKTDWGTQDFYVEDPDGHILCFGGT